jgi:hypothetical protein
LLSVHVTTNRVPPIDMLKCFVADKISNYFQFVWKLIPQSRWKYFLECHHDICCLWFVCTSWPFMIHVFRDKKEIKHRDPQNRVNIGMYVFTSQSPVLWPAQSRFGIPRWQLAFTLWLSHHWSLLSAIHAVTLQPLSAGSLHTQSKCLWRCVRRCMWLFLTDIAHRLSCNETTCWKLFPFACDCVRRNSSSVEGLLGCSVGWGTLSLNYFISSLFNDAFPAI